MINQILKAVHADVTKELQDDTLPFPEAQVLRSALKYLDTLLLNSEAREVAPAAAKKAKSGSNKQKQKAQE